MIPVASQDRPWIGLLLGILFLASAAGSALAGEPPPPNVSGSTSGEIEGKSFLPEYRTRPAAFEHVVPPRVSLEGGGVRFQLPYATLSRKDIHIARVLDPDCPGYDFYKFEALVEDPAFSYLKTWPDGAPEEEIRKAFASMSSPADGYCPNGEWRVPLSGLAATQAVALDLKRAWERFEDRYFWRVVTDVNNPTYYIAYCMLGLGFPSFTDKPSPAYDFIPPGALPPELGGVFSEEVLGIVSEYKKNLGLGGEREAAPNYKAASAGQFRKPLYLPFVPTIDPKEFCDGLGLKLPIFHIPAIQVKVCAVPVWSSPGYPDKPWVFDEGEANRRISGAMAHAMSNYYADYLADTVLKSLLPLSNLSTQVQTTLDSLKNLTPGNLVGAVQSLEGSLYFPVPWQVPLAGGGAVVAPVYEYLYPDPFRVGLDIMTIYDMVGVMLRGESLSDLEKVALALYYLQPVLAYMDMPLMPGIVDEPVGKLIGGPVQLLYEAVSTTAQKVLEGFLAGIDSAAESAFGPEAGPFFAAGVRVILAPVMELFIVKDPRYLVSSLIALLRKIDEFLLAFAEDKAPHFFDNKVNGVTVAPGMWRFEELKRTFPVSNPYVQSLFGYGSFFAAWDQVEATLIPDFTASWAPAEYMLALLSRLVGFWHIPFWIDVCPPFYAAVGADLPRYMPVAPYFLPFVGERIHWGWFNVPEGYPVPLVKGIPGAPAPSLGASHPLSGKDLSGGGSLITDLYERTLLGLQPSR